MPNGFFGQYLQKRSKTEKKNITIEFCIFKLVWVPNFNFNKQFLFFEANCHKREYHSKTKRVNITIELFMFELDSNVSNFS